MIANPSLMEKFWLRAWCGKNIDTGRVSKNVDVWINTTNDVSNKKHFATFVTFKIQKYILMTYSSVSCVVPHN